MVRCFVCFYFCEQRVVLGGGDFALSDAVFSGDAFAFVFAAHEVHFVAQWGECGVPEQGAADEDEQQDEDWYLVVLHWGSSLKGLTGTSVGASRYAPGSGSKAAGSGVLSSS